MHSCDFQAAFDAGTHQQIVLQEIHGIPHVLVPPGSDLKALERLLPAPQRIVAHPAFPVSYTHLTLPTICSV